MHGGFNGSECLADTWALDLETWHWQCVEARVGGRVPQGLRDVVAKQQGGGNLAAALVLWARALA